VPKGRYLGLSLLILVDILVYAVVVYQFLSLAQGEASIAPPFATTDARTTATLMRVVPTFGIPAIAAVVAALTYWRSGRKIFPTVLGGAISAFVLDCLALWGSIPVV
jgi:hypothetical protein